METLRKRNTLNASNCAPEKRFPLCGLSNTGTTSVEVKPYSGRVLLLCLTPLHNALFELNRQTSTFMPAINL